MPHRFYIKITLIKNARKNLCCFKGVVNMIGMKYINVKNKYMQKTFFSVFAIIKMCIQLFPNKLEILKFILKLYFMEYICFL